MYDDLTQEVEQFLYREARLLDERRLHEWLELFTDDARYWMGGRSNRYSKSSKAIAIFDPEPYLEDDLTNGGELAILDETKETVASASLASKRAWSGWRTLRRARAI
jgi:3-phenylpropionate/cinnamic acid dioxygenase small subunit